MPSILNRSVTTLLILFGSISLANAQSSATQQSTSSPGTSGWTWVQDNPLIFCVGNVTTCAVTIGNIAPTTAGSVWILFVQVPNHGVTITNVTGGGGTWVHCPNCHADNPSGFDADAWYNLSGNAGTFQGITFTLSGSSGAFISSAFVELLPPPGTTASFDTSGTATPTNCTTCTGPALTLSGTDFVYINPGGNAKAGWNASTAPYITDSNGGTLGVNITSGAAPSITFKSVSNPEFFAIAFKSTSGSFTPPTHQYSITNFTTSGSINCNPNCSVLIPSTGSNHLLFLEAGDEFFTHITSVSGGGTWVVPTGANTCQIQFNILSQNNANSCAYALSSTPGATSITVTMSGSAATSFAVWEIATTSGNFILDTQASQINNSNSYYNNGPALTLTGTNDVVFESEWCVGGSSGPTYYAQPNIPTNNPIFVGPVNYFLQNESSSVVLLDSGPTPPVPTWLNPQNDPTFVSAVAFTTTGVSALPNPPTGLTAIVH